MTLAHRVVRAIKRFLFRDAPEFAGLDVTRDEAILLLSQTGTAVTPADIASMSKAKGKGAKQLRMRVAAWLIVHYEESLRNGYWPEMSPDKIPTHSGHVSDGWFVNQVDWAIEISYRVSQCGGDGELCWRYYRGEPVELTPGTCERINRALLYCAGLYRRKITYKMWCQQGGYVHS